MFNTVKQEALQVCLADASYWVDVSAGAVILGEIPCQTEQEQLVNGQKGGCNNTYTGALSVEHSLISNCYCVNPS